MYHIPDMLTPILIVDDDVGLLASLKTALVSSGLTEPALISEGQAVVECLAERHFQLIILDLVMPGMDGIDLLKEIKARHPQTECIMLTAIDDTATAVQAIKYGAYDYLVKPVEREKLIITINRALERYSLKQGIRLLGSENSFADLNSPEAFNDIIAGDEEMARVFHQVETVAPTDYSVVITGESGTGKEMIARAIHRISKRSQAPFVAVNMAAFSKSLFEDEFFGHAKGAFTDAREEKPGFFEQAQRGTIFLDEIVDLAPALQVKLLRVLQEGELYRIGSTRARSIDVRIICATNQDISARINAGDFRADLFHRLNAYSIHLQPLRRRKKDILPLAAYFLKRHTRANDKQIDSIAPDLERVLTAYAYPGNVRELENLIAAAVLAEKTATLTLAAFQAPDLSAAAPLPISTDVTQSLAYVQKQHILRVLESSSGNRTRAAKILGIGLRTLQRKLKEYEQEPAAPE
jgi:DNA-binding NtrC family response regulator